MKKKKPSKSAPVRKYESTRATKEAISRIHSCFEDSRKSLDGEKKRAASPEGVLRATLQALLQARKTIAETRRELDEAIATLRRALPRRPVPRR